MIFQWRRLNSSGHAGNRQQVFEFQRFKGKQSMYRSSGLRKRIFICFDYDNDRRYRYLLSALNENTSSSIEFEDLTPEEIQSSAVGPIKSALTRRIKRSTHTLVIVGGHTNDYHADWREIGERNWQWWEIERSKEEGLGLIAVKIADSNLTLDPLLGAGATWARAFRVESIVNAINTA